MDITNAQPVYLNPTRSASERSRDLLARMTLDEKLAQITSFWFSDLLDNQVLSHEKMQALLGHGIGQISRVAGTSTLAPVEVARAGNAIQRFLAERTRLGIPAILHEECCSGYMGLGGTVFPQMIGLASSWNPALAEQVTNEIRCQMLAVGARQGLAPVLDIGSDPRWGRIEETFGEDPFLVTQFGTAYIRGLQGEDRQTGILATGKHFVGHSLSAGGLNCAPVQLGPRTLWDVYLMPFQAAIREARLGSVMNAYPELDGEVVAASPAILTDLLRDKLGFRGIVVSDYNAIDMLHTYHRVAPDQQTAAAKALRAGIEIELPTHNYYGEPLRAALEAGDVSSDDIDTIVERILTTKFELGLFDNPYVDEGAVVEVFETLEQRTLAREAARQSMVLLKNDSLLPLAQPKIIAVIGPNADAPRHQLGDYSYQAMSELMTLSPLPNSPFAGSDRDAAIAAHCVQVPSILAAIRAQVGEGTQVLYARGCSVSESDRSGFAEAVRVAGQADVVVLVLGDKAGLVPDCTCGETRDRAELGLPGVQEDLARGVVAAGKPVVAVLVNGRPISSPWLQDSVSAILEAWLPGEEGAGAVADVLFGACNPGGKLPVSVARSVGQVPLSYNHKPSGGRSNWYIDYVEMPVGPLYPFGHGLSYTTFSYDDLTISPAQAGAGQTIEISLSVANTGKVSGDEVVQLYIHDEYACLPRPLQELKGFYRLTLDPGEKRRVTFHLPVNLLAFYDQSLELVVEAGTIRVMVGSSSKDIRLVGSFEITGADQQPISERVFTCPVTVE